MSHDPQQVTEEMVTTALRAIFHADPLGQKDDWWPDNMRADVRRGIESAIAAAPSAPAALGDAELSASDIANMRAIYTPPPIPPCCVCGGPLSIGAIGGGKPTQWACSGMDTDPERED